MTSPAAIPVYLLTGFLGAGKTTLLQRLLAAERAAGRTPAVLMNEFGERGIDTLLVGAETTVRELLGGCICCSLQNDLLITLAELVEQHPDSLFI
ncbi:MAG: GTP-binding protein, partial [bacterium]